MFLENKKRPMARMSKKVVFLFLDIQNLPLSGKNPVSLQVDKFHNLGDVCFTSLGYSIIWE